MSKRELHRNSPYMSMRVRRVNKPTLCWRDVLQLLFTDAHGRDERKKQLNRASPVRPAGVRPQSLSGTVSAGSIASSVNACRNASRSANSSSVSPSGVSTVSAWGPMSTEFSSVL